MPSPARSIQRFLPSRRERVAPPPAADQLNEFAPEHATMPAPRPVALRVTVAWLTVAQIWTAVASIVLLSSLVAIRDTATKPRSVVAPAASPIEVEFPEYPGAPLLQTAVAAVPGRLTPDTQAEQVSANAGQGSAVVASFSPRQVQPRSQPRPLTSGVVAALEAPNPFDVRSRLPQVVSAMTSELVSPLDAAEQSTLVDAPPRRIGPPLTLKTVGGAVTRNARLSLVLDVTDQGDVARVLAHEAVDVPPDMIESIAMAARGWRYEPARRDGVAVPARIRVVVQLGGGD